MTLDELRIALAGILDEEVQPQVNWADVEFLSERTYIRMTEPGTPQDFPQEEVISYLAAFNRRRVDGKFADQQRQWLRSYLQSDWSE